MTKHGIQNFEGFLKTFDVRHAGKGMSFSTVEEHDRMVIEDWEEQGRPLNIIHCRTFVFKGRTYQVLEEVSYGSLILWLPEEEKYVQGCDLVEFDSILILGTYYNSKTKVYTLLEEEPKEEGKPYEKD